MEKQFINWLKSDLQFAPQVRLGIGDDAAVLNAMEGQTVLTCDAIVDQVHFDLSKHSPEEIGHKALAVNLSDLAAMGASPTACLMTLTVNNNIDLKFCQRLTQGLRELGDRFDCPLIGGDFVKADGPLHVSVTAVGNVPGGGYWTLDRAEPGDAIIVSGPLGGSILGRHLEFTPRIDLARQLRGISAVKAATDISDGLAVDLAAICEASSRAETDRKNVGAEIVLDKIPISDAAEQLSQQSKRQPIDHALYDGEDFELILVVAQNLVKPVLDFGAASGCGPFFEIGTIVESQGIYSLDSKHEVHSRRKLLVQGYEH